MVENNYHVLEEDKEVYSDIWNKEKKALINYEVVDLLNEQDKRIKELETRNKRQYKQLKKITDLMYKRNWERLEEMVNDWEQWEKQLEQEWGTYYGDVE